MKLVKKGGVVYADGVPLREAAAGDIQPLLVVVGPMGPTAEFFGYHRDTYVVYCLKDSALQPHVRQLIQDGVLALFSLRNPIGGPGTLELFWSGRDNKVLTKHLAAAMQLYVTEDELVITHMSVRKSYQRQRLNSLLVDFVLEHWPERKIVFDDPTQQGKHFMQSRGFSGLRGGW